MSEDDAARYWALIRKTRQFNQSLGRELVARYAEILFQPESATTYRKLPEHVVRQLRQDALLCVHKVERVVAPSGRSALEIEPGDSDARLEREPPSYPRRVQGGGSCSLLNNLSGRLEGKGEFYKIIYGMKPSTALMSGFIVPMPQDERVGDEEADPIRISAHGMDLQILTSDAGETLTVSVRGAVYVRILPTVDEIKPGGRLEPVFPLNAEARTLLRTKVGRHSSNGGKPPRR
jgi:hypothetical protein